MTWSRTTIEDDGAGSATPHEGLLRGQRDTQGKCNYFISTKVTTNEELELAFADYTLPNAKVGVVFIAQNLAERIKDKIIEHQENEETLVPVVMEIPSKEAEYDPKKDTMLV